VKTDLEDPNIAVLLFVAEQLGSLRRQVVFVGGATVGLLITDPGAPAIRVTDDVDCIIEVSTLARYYELAAQLRELGFTPDPEGPICRFRVAHVKVDVMPTEPSIAGFANSWAREAISRSSEQTLGDLTIRVITAPYFIGTKLEAFRGRGQGDLFASHDIEDLIAVVDGRSSLVEEVESDASEGLKEYLATELAVLLENDRFAEIVAAHLPPDPASQQRASLVSHRLRAIAISRSHG